MRQYIAELRTVAEQAHRRNEEAQSARNKDDRIKCETPLTEQIEALERVAANSIQIPPEREL